MPIYEFYCPDNHTIYQFYAKTLRQGQTTPKCPDNPKYRMKKIVSAFAIPSGGGKSDEEPKADGAPGETADDPRMEAAMGVMEKEFAHIDQNDPRAMARMVRKMSELTGEKLVGEAEEVVRKLEEGADPESLEQLEDDGRGRGDAGDELMGGGDRPPGDPDDPKEPRHRFRVRRSAARRDPKLYDYE
ncbi:MAG: FmdB family transcriptional regulator [Opitutaceae bacterium]